MSLSVEVKISGDKELIKKLKNMGESFMDFSDANKIIGNELKGYYGNQAFASQGGVFGVRWPTLASATVREKLRRYPLYASSPLIRTTKMKRSFVYEASKSQVFVTNTVKSPNGFNYFVAHQLGTRHVPPRPMIGINNDIKSIVKKIIQSDIDAKIRRA